MKRKDEEYLRITAPQHVVESHFTQHERVEGFFESETLYGPQRSDRLLRLDTIYGSIQLGYSPRKRQSFIFARNKSSIFGAAPARYQRELADYQAMRALKTGTQNQAFTARRRQNSAVLLYKMENLPWSHRSVAAYLDKADMGTLTGTMPFLDTRAERLALAEHAIQRRSLEGQLRQKMLAGRFAEMAPVRAAQTDMLRQQGNAQALLYKKETQSRLFFRRLNIAFDLQKQQMFAYYRNLRQGLGTGYETPEPPKPNKGEDEDD